MYISELVFTGLWYAVGWDKLIPFGDTAISEVRVMMNLLVVLIFWSVSGLFIFIWNRTKQKQLSVVGLQIVLPCLIVQNLLTACFLMIQGAGDVSGCVNILEGIFIFCECALIYYEMFFTRKKELLAEEVKTMEEKIVFNTKFYDESLERYQKMREMRHDTKNYLQTLEYLVEVEPEEAEKMLEILKKRITE